MRLRQLTEPQAEPVTYEQAQDHLHLTEDSEAGEVDIVMKAARSRVEAFTGRNLIKRQVRQVLDCFPRSRMLTLAASPISPSSQLSTSETQLVVRYFPQGNSSGVIWSSTNYILSEDSDPPRIVLARDQEFPNTELRMADGVHLEYWTGYSTGPAGVPAWARMAILLDGAHLFLHRESVATGTVATEIPQSAQALMWQYRSPLAQV